MRLNIKTGIVVHRKITWLLLFSIFSLAIASWLIYIAQKNTERTNLRINQTHQLIETAQEIIISLSASPTASISLPDPLTAPASSSLPTAPYKHTGLQQLLTQIRDLSRINNDQPQRIARLEPAIRSEVSPSSAISLLYTIIQEEKLILAGRQRIYEDLSHRTSYGMILARTLAAIFVIILLIQLNRDITRHKTTQEQLVQAIREAQAARQLQEQFLANMSHEIRTPMNGIKGMTDLLMDTPLSTRQHELTGMIKSSAGNLLVIINDILDFSKIKAGRLNIEKIDFDLHDVLDTVTASFQHLLRKKGLTLRTEIAANIPPVLTGDPHRLNQVLINILSNAIKFTDHGEISIQINAEPALADEVLLHFIITDTGVGIPAGSLPYIFDSFAQAGRDISRRYGGTGLGLTICRQLLHLQGGNISATSTEGKGSSFHFHIPYGFKDRPNTRIAIDAPGDYSNLLRGRHFLVAEDNEINQKLIDYVLTKAGATVEIAGNGAEAVEYLRNGHTCDCIIMDLQMPEMDGYAATRCIRNDLRMHTPIIAMTATAMKGEHLQCLESGMNEYMTKPFEFVDLYKRISSLLS